MKAALKSSNMKKEMQAALPPLVIDALVQTDLIAREDEACQTEESIRVDCEVQANPERRSFCTQTIKVEADEITMPNLPSSKKVTKKKVSSSSKPGPKKAKKRKISSIETSTSNTDHTNACISNSRPASLISEVPVQLTEDHIRITQSIVKSILRYPKKFTQINTDNPVHLCTFLKVKSP